MSVEDAQEAIWRAIMVWERHKHADDYDAEGAVDAALGRLILEVRAAMPCYDRWTTEDVEPCPSCTARAEREAAG